MATESVQGIVSTGPFWLKVSSLRKTRLGYFVLSPPSNPGLSQFLLAFRKGRGAERTHEAASVRLKTFPPLRMVSYGIVVFDSSLLEVQTRRRISFVVGVRSFRDSKCKSVLNESVSLE